MRGSHLLIAAMIVSLAGCGGGETASDDAAGGTATSPAAPETTTEETETTTEQTPTETQGGAAVISVAETELGEVLVDGEGFTLYLFDEDSEGVSNCSGGCAETWPPVTVDGEPSAEEGADESLLGTIERDDGSTQVTYAGQPLYRYAPDAAPGDVTGQAVGDVWWVVDPGGEAIRDSANTAEQERTYDY